MGILREILIGVAAAAAFFIVEKYLIDWPYPWDLASTIVVFAVAIGLAFFFQGNASGRKKGDLTIASGNEVERNMKARIEGSEAQSAGAVLSNNKVGGDAEFEIKNSKF